jgi:hypothetical protein
MLRADRLPGSLLGLLEEFRSCFTAPTFTTFALLAAGLIARPAGRTVCGMLAGAGLGGVGITAGRTGFSRVRGGAPMRWDWWCCGW